MRRAACARDPWAAAVLLHFCRPPYAPMARRTPRIPSPPHAGDRPHPMPLPAARTFDFSRFDRLNFGCGYDKMPGYLNVDVDPACEPDVLLPGGDVSMLPKHHFAEVYAKDVLEHIPRARSLDALLEFASLLQDRGRLMVQTTSILDVARKFAENPSFADQYGWTICLFGNQAHPGDYHFTAFTDTTLTVHLAAAGFAVTSRGMSEGWIMRFECVKERSWDGLLDARCGDVEFVGRAYRQFFGRAIDEVGRIHFGGKLERGEPRRAVLKEIACAPEHLYVTARDLGL